MKSADGNIGLAGLRFHNRMVNELPGETERGVFPRQVTGAIWSHVAPTPVSNPKVLLWSSEMLRNFGLDDADALEPGFARVFAGNELLPDMVPHATCYGGHQFGHWAGQLGDGRAINLGDAHDVNGQLWTLQLKGAGPTPYSRGADGRAVLRSSLREFLCSEAMYHLGVPTTRALCLVSTGDRVVRDMFYDGNPQAEPGAVVCRVSESFLRFGHFQMLAARGETALLAQLLDFSIRHDHPTILEQFSAGTQAARLEWFRRVCSATADMIVHWQRLGFVHGVMNTDNMSVLGQTIDYGPYGWLDDYDPGWTPNTTDAEGRRYRYGAQPDIALWNLYQLANALMPVLDDADALKAVLHDYQLLYARGWRAMMAGKLGFSEFREDTDASLVEALEQLLVSREIDMTLFYRGLGDLNIADDAQVILGQLSRAFYDEHLADDGEWVEQLLDWVRQWQRRAGEDDRTDQVRRDSMNRSNPCYVLRNYLAQQAIDAAEQGDLTVAWQLLEVMRNPYQEQAGRAEFAALRPDWARHRAGCSMLSCSS